MTTASTFSARLAALWLLATILGPVQAAPPPPAAFFDAPAISGAALSPDGQLLAMRVRTKDSRPRLAVIDLQTMKPTVVADMRDADIGHFEWVNSKRLVYSLDIELTGPSEADLAHGLFAVNHDGSGFRQLVDATNAFAKSDPLRGVQPLPYRTYLLRGAAAQNSDDVFVVSPDEFSRKTVGFIRLQKLNTLTGRSTEVDAPPHSNEWLIDSQGRLRATVSQRDNREAVHLADASGAWRKVAEVDAVTGPFLKPRFIAPDGQIYVEAPHGDKTALFTLDAASGKPADKPVAASKDFDLHPSFVVGRDKLLGLRYTVDGEVTQWLDPALQALQNKIDALLPSTANRISVARTGSSPFVLIEARSDVQPLVIHVYNTETDKLTRVGASRPGIDPRQMGQMDFVRIKARDGLELPAYLTLPPGGASKNLPMVVLVHGGPWSRGTDWGWDAEVQFLASRGYAVLQPEFRGSTGFGRKHFEAGFKQWGGAMQHDLADAARWAIAQGIADPKRICIAGASYGGYATLMGLAQEPELFRCGINWVGVTDIKLMYDVGWSDLSDEWKRYGMPRLIGDPTGDAAMLKAVSPLENAARIKQPLLMAYGAWDLRVPIVHGEKFLAAVKAHNPAVDWVVYDNEAHGWSKPKTQIDFWTRVEAFLNRNIGKP